MNWEIFFAQGFYNQCPIRNAFRAIECKCAFDVPLSMRDGVSHEVLNLRLKDGFILEKQRIEGRFCELGFVFYTVSVERNGLN